MILGFTGTRYGMTLHQYDKVKSVVERCLNDEGSIEAAYHGGCDGADGQFHEILRKVCGYELLITIYPSNFGRDAKMDDIDLVALEDNTKLMTEKHPLDRNKDIVDSCDIIIATPKEFKEVLRSGTWATIRYARKQGKEVVVIYPD